MNSKKHLIRPSASVRKRISVVAPVLFFAAVASFFILRSLAATDVFVSLQPENWDATGSVRVGSDANASLGRYVKFGASGTYAAWAPSSVQESLGFASGDIGDAETWLNRKNSSGGLEKVKFQVQYATSRKGTPTQALGGFKDIINKAKANGRTIILTIPMAFDPEVRDSAGKVTYVGGCQGWNASKHRQILKEIVDTSPDNGTKNPGSDDDIWSGMGAHIKSVFGTTGSMSFADGRPIFIMRPGWESNGSWFCWSTQGDSSTNSVTLGPEFRAAYRHIHDMVQTAAGRTDMLWDYGINAGPGSPHAAAQDAYPGDAYIDIVDLDVYDTNTGQYWHDRTIGEGVKQATLTQQQITELNSPADLTRFPTVWAQKSSAMNQVRDDPLWSTKMIGIGEWGNWHEVWKNAPPIYYPDGGGDNPEWVSSMAAWIRPIAAQRRFAFNIQFDHRVDQGETWMYSQLSGSNTQLPKSSAEFLKQFK